MSLWAKSADFYRFLLGCCSYQAKSPGRILQLGPWPTTAGSFGRTKVIQRIEQFQASFELEGGWSISTFSDNHIDWHWSVGYFGYLEFHCEAKGQSFYGGCLCTWCWSNSCCLESEGTSSISPALWYSLLRFAGTTGILTYLILLDLIYPANWGSAINICQTLGLSTARQCKTCAFVFFQRCVTWKGLGHSLIMFDWRQGVSPEELLTSMDSCLSTGAKFVYGLFCDVLMQSFWTIEFSFLKDGLILWRPWQHKPKEVFETWKTRGSWLHVDQNATWQFLRAMHSNADRISFSLCFYLFLLFWSLSFSIWRLFAMLSFGENHTMCSILLCFRGLQTQRASCSTGEELRDDSKLSNNTEQSAQRKKMKRVFEWIGVRGHAAAVKEICHLAHAMHRVWWTFASPTQPRVALCVSQDRRRELGRCQKIKNQKTQYHYYIDFISLYPFCVSKCVSVLSVSCFTWNVAGRKPCSCLPTADLRSPRRGRELAKTRWGATGMLEKKLMEQIGVDANTALTHHESQVCALVKQD